jgi:hypothetical protein
VGHSGSISEDGDGDGDGDGDIDGTAVESFGEDGRLGCRVRESDGVDEVDVTEPQSEIDVWIERPVRLDNVVEAVLKSDLAGEVVMEFPGDSDR